MNYDLNTKGKILNRLNYHFTFADYHKAFILYTRNYMFDLHAGRDGYNNKILLYTFSIHRYSLSGHITKYKKSMCENKNPPFEPYVQPYKERVKYDENLAFIESYQELTGKKL